MSRVHELLENHGHTVHRHATRVHTDPMAELSRSLEREEDSEDSEDSEEAAERVDFDEEEGEEKDELAALSKARVPFTERANALARRYDEKPLLGKRKFIASVLERLEGMDDAIIALEREEEERRAYLMNEKLKQLLIAPDKMDEMNELERREKMKFWDGIKSWLSSTKNDEGTSSVEVTEEETDAGGTSRPETRRHAIIMGTAESDQMVSILGALALAHEWSETQTKESNNFMKRIAIKLAKTVVCVGLFVVCTIIGASGIGIAMLGLGIGIAFAVLEFRQDRAEGDTAGGLGALIFNMAKGGAMTALGVEVRQRPPALRLALSSHEIHSARLASSPQPCAPRSADLLRRGRSGRQRSRPAVHGGRRHTRRACHSMDQE